MTIIYSQDVKEKLTHVTSIAHGKQMLKEGVKLENKHPLYNKKAYIEQARTKPWGFWISVNNGWEEWCKGENYGYTDENRTILNVELSPNLKLWKIDNMKDFIEIWEEYTGKPNKDKDLNLCIFWKPDSKNFWQWLKQKGFHGVYITDKGQYETRFDTWLYGWDCASIVIFNPKQVSVSE